MNGDAVHLGVVLLVVWACACVCSAAGEDDFYAYYTRLNYDIPLLEARSYIPTALDEESRALLRRLEPGKEKEEESREERKFSGSGPITGKHADIIVHVRDAGELVFSRETSYLPYWKTPSGQFSFQELVARQKDIACLYSYVRIIEIGPDRILIHWRYMPDLRDVGMTKVVHEFFEVHPDGKVVRRVKRGTEDLDEWNDPENETIQRLKLLADGVRVVSLEPAKLSRRALPAVVSADVKRGVIGKPVAWWKFDEGRTTRPYDAKDMTEESVGNEACRVEGNVTLWKQGVSGTALAFDGYKSKVTMPAAHAPKVKDKLAVEAWVVLGAYPWNWAPLVHQSVMDPGPIEKGTYDQRGHSEVRKEGQGYYLGIGPYGHPVFAVDDKELSGSVRLPTYRWTHVAGVYGDGKMQIYVDGQLCGSMEATGDVNVPNVDLLIGLNNVKGRATDPVRGPMCHMGSIYGIEGIIDEVKIYDSVLSPSEVAASYDSFKPGDELRGNTGLAQRILPGRPGAASRFGAEYTELRYHELWDNLWRTSYPDVLVKFDDSPTSITFWRGVNGGAGWVTENNKWMSDQSVELGGYHGCAEHMADKECRHAHVRVIENTDARVVVHWRYASIDVGYLFPNIRFWTDEYYHIYPDGAAVRKVYFRRGTAGWHDIQFLSQPGTGCLDNIYLQALTVANIKGEVHKMTWQGSNGVPQNPLEDASIAVVNMKSDYKVYLVYPDGVHIGTWGSDEQSPHTDDPFAGPWNHWPVSQIPSDGRYAVANDRLTHAALGGAGDVTRHDNMILYGLTNKSIETLIPLSQSWNFAPPVVQTKNCESEGYSKEQRAYQLKAKDSSFSFAIDASKESPICNACFVVRHWTGKEAALSIDGKALKPGRAFRQGIVRDTDGTKMLIVWAQTTSVKPVHFSMNSLDW